MQPVDPLATQSSGVTLAERVLQTASELTCHVCPAPFWSVADVILRATAPVKAGPAGSADPPEVESSYRELLLECTPDTRDFLKLWPSRLDCERFQSLRPAYVLGALQVPPHGQGSLPSVPGVRWTCRCIVRQDGPSRLHGRALQFGTVRRGTWFC